MKVQGGKMVPVQGKQRIIRVLTGHLTEVEKAAIKAMLERNIMAGKIARKEYHIQKTGDTYTVKVMQMDRGLIPVAGSALRMSTNTSTFTYL